jgi:hypothetical protein
MATPTITADLVVHHDLYAKTNVNGYDASLSRVKQTFTAGQLIGNIYSYIQSGSNVYWLVYVNSQDFANQNPTYILHETGKLDVPDLPNIVQAIADKQKQDQIDKVGIVQYYLDNYLPYIVGAIVVAIVLPKIIKSTK